MHDYEPELIDITSLGDTTRVYRTYTTPSYITESTTWPSTYISAWSSSTTSSSGDKMDHKRPHSALKTNYIECSNVREHIVFCKDSDDLSPAQVLKSISSMKTELAIDCAPYRIEKIECGMTPAVKDNIMAASRRLRMYGKKLPIIPRFDDYGRRLPDEITIDTTTGLKINILNPDEYGKIYFELKGIECSY